MSTGPIPFLAIVEYCEVFGIAGTQREDFIWITQRLDQKYMEWSGKRAKSG